MTSGRALDIFVGFNYRSEILNYIQRWRLLLYLRRVAFGMLVVECFPADRALNADGSLQADSKTRYARTTSD